MKKTLSNANIEEATQNVPDIKVIGNGDIVSAYGTELYIFNVHTKAFSTVNIAGSDAAYRWAGEH